MATNDTKPAATPTATPAPVTTAATQPIQQTNAHQQTASSQKANTMSLNESSKTAPENNTPTNTDKQQNPAPETSKSTAQETDKKITAESLKGLTVDQLNALLINGVHNADETKAINDAKKTADGNDGNDGEHFAESKDGEQPQGKERDDKGPFKEGDIINYMYNDWLIAGANWLWNKSAEKLDGAYFRTRNAFAQAHRNEVAKERAQGKKVETKKAHGDIDEYCTTKMSQKSAFMGDYNDKMQENIAKAKEGKLEETTFDEQTKKLLAGLPEDKRKDFCKYLSKSMENLQNNLINIEQSSALISKAQMAAEICQDPKAFEGKNTNEIFDAYQKKNKALLAKRLEQEKAEGRDPTDFMNKTLKLAVKASEQADQNIAKGKYAERDEKPGKNEYLDKINKSLGASATNSASNDNEPQSIYEMGLGGNLAEAQKMQLNEIKDGLGEIPNRRANNEVRQDKLVAMYSKIAAQDPSKAADMNRRIANLQATGPESGVVKADRIAESKIAENSTQRKMSEMFGANR